MASDHPGVTVYRRGYVWMCVFLLLSFAGSARAQEARGAMLGTVAVTAGATFGHETSGALGAETVLRIGGPLAWFVEGGYLWNAASDELTARAQRIATAVSGDATMAARVSFVDSGLRLQWPVASHLATYVTGGVGVARVRQETTFFKGGAAIVPETHGIQVGADLSGVVTKPVVVAGGGAVVTIGSRSFIDLGVRYTRIIARSSRIPFDEALDVVRLQAGVGIGF